MDDHAKLLATAKAGIEYYLARSLEAGRIDQQLYQQAQGSTFANLQEWLQDRAIDEKRPKIRLGIEKAIREAEKQFRKAESQKKELAADDPRMGDIEEEGLRGWEQIVNAFRQKVRFGTGGIRGLMAFDLDSIKQLHQSIDSPILKGPGTINDLVFLLTSAGVAKYGRERTPPFHKVVIGYDSRIGGRDLAQLIASLFLKEGYTVYLFDEPCPYPEVTFAIPYAGKDWGIKADVGILISASHNDYRYNGYKLSCSNGSQFDPEERDAMYNRYIKNARPEDIDFYASLKDAPADKLIFLGGSRPVDDFDYAGRKNRLGDSLRDIHTKHIEHIKSFLLTPNLAEQQKRSKNPLEIGYCAFYGAGRLAVPRLLREVGFLDDHLHIISYRGLDTLNGLFPCFNYKPGQEQQPDPGDPRSAEIIIDAFRHDFPDKLDDVDIIIGTDPDADRCGVVVRVPEDQRKLYPKRFRIETNEQSDRAGFVVPISPEDQSHYPLNKHMLLPADYAWAVLLWYRLEREAEQNGKIVDADKKFITLSHTTSDFIVSVARKNGVGVIRTWVGFAALAAATRDAWQGEVEEMASLVEGRSQDMSKEYAQKQLCHPFVCDCQGMDAKRSINIAAMEQSNGFSILGGPPADPGSLGRGGHVRDKDGTFAALLLAEVAAWAKEDGKTLFELMDDISLDPEIGLFVNLYEPDPLDGEYPGIEGDRQKKAILRRALGYFQLAFSGDLEIGGVPVVSATMYRTGKYDAIYPPTYDFIFPDEGVRYYFNKEKTDHLTVRPSGTGNALRFHIQLHDGDVTRENLVEKKKQLYRKGGAIMDGIREKLRAPRY
jgi:phosphoglucomutase